MNIVTDVAWSSAYDGSLSCLVDGKQAHIPTDREWFVKMGYVIFLFETYAENHAGLLPSVTIPAKGTRPEIRLQNCVKSARLARLWKGLKRALNDGTFEEGRPVDPGPIELP